MTVNHKKPDIRLLFFIATHKLSRKAERLFSERHVSILYQAYAKGTASGEIADMFGIGSIDKSVLVSILPKQAADETLKKLQNRLHLGMPQTGIAFSVPLSGSSASILRLMHESEKDSNDTEKNGGKNMDDSYTMIMAFVNQGFSEEVMAAARPAGATGGTVFHSRQIGDADAFKLWGITIQQEREIVLVLAEKEKKLAIMKSISEKCGAGSDAHGIVISLPVDSVAGLNKDI